MRARLLSTQCLAARDVSACLTPPAAPRIVPCKAWQISCFAAYAATPIADSPACPQMENGGDILEDSEDLAVAKEVLAAVEATFKG